MANKRKRPIKRVTKISKTQRKQVLKIKLKVKDARFSEKSQKSLLQPSPSSFIKSRFSRRSNKGKVLQKIKLNKKNEAPANLRLGFHLPSLLRKQSPSVTEKSSRSSSGLHPRISAKRDKAPIKKEFIQRFFSRRKILISSAIFLFFITTSIWLFWDIPLPTQLVNQQIPVSTKLFDRNGDLIYEIYTDTRRDPVKIEDLPEYIKQATIAIEDKDFYKHHGVSITGIIRAAYKTVFKQKLEGGSTLTQQLVKNALLTPERTIRRKAREFVLTLLVETLYSKDQILEMYFNQIPYGSTAYGIGAASELYFGKRPSQLTLAESSLLAGITAAPTRFSPFGAHPELSKGRQDTVLNRMVEDGYISQEEANNAKNVKLNYAEPERLKAPHFTLWVKEQLAEKYGDSVVEQGGLRVTTTLDLDLQEFTESAVATEVAKLKKSNVGNGAALVIRPGSGEILAMVGSKNYFAQDEDGKVNIVFAQRQPGSSIKPLNYVFGIKEGKITASTPLADVPTCFSTFGQAAYCPKNYDNTFHGAVQARFALGNSYNIPAVRVLAVNGIENFFNFAKTMGITTWTEPKNYGLSLTLGGGEVRMYDMAQAFGVLANQGIKQPLISILKVEDWKGKVLEETEIENVDKESKRVLDPEPAFIISHILQDNNARSAAFGASSFLNVSGHSEVSVKTGTTNDLRDNWTIGYTPQILVATWVGNNDNTPMSRAVSGVSGASPIWNEVIKSALDRSEKGEFNSNDEGHAWPNQPDGIVGSNVCVTNGNRPDNPDDPGCATRFEYFLKDHVGAGIESGSKDIEVFKDTGQVVYQEVPPEQKHVQNHPFLLDPLGTLVCLDCPIASASASIRYPLIITRNIPTD